MIDKKLWSTEYVTLIGRSCWCHLDMLTMAVTSLKLWASYGSIAGCTTFLSRSYWCRMCSSRFPWNGPQHCSVSLISSSTFYLRALWWYNKFCLGCGHLYGNILLSVLMGVLCVATLDWISFFQIRLLQHGVNPCWGDVLGVGGVGRMQNKKSHRCLCVQRHVSF